MGGVKCTLDNCNVNWVDNKRFTRGSSILQRLLWITLDALDNYSSPATPNAMPIHLQRQDAAV